MLTRRRVDPVPAISPDRPETFRLASGMPCLRVASRLCDFPEVGLRAAEETHARRRGWTVVSRDEEWITLGESAPTPQVEADVDVRITPAIRPHGVDRKTDGIWIRGKRSGTAKAIHPVQRRLKKIMSRETRSVSDMPAGSICACRAQCDHRSNCRD
jgi:hypothetical protein